MRASLFAFILLVLLSGCSPNAVVENQLSANERSIFRGAIDDISRGDGPALAKRMPSELAEKIVPVFPRMHEAMPTAPLEVSLDSMHLNSAGGTRNAEAVYEVHGRSGWAIVEATARTARAGTALTGIYVQPVSASPRELNRFDLAQAGPAHWAVLAAMFAALAVTVAALLRIWRSGLFRRRWLWTIGAVIGLTTLRLNWSTGQTFFQPISFSLFSVGAVKTPIYAPWILSVSLPVVALAALLRRRRSDASMTD